MFKAGFIWQEFCYENPSTVVASRLTKPFNLNRTKTEYNVALFYNVLYYVQKAERKTATKIRAGIY